MSFASSALRRLGQEGPRLARRVHVGRPALGGYVSQDSLVLLAGVLKKVSQVPLLWCLVTSVTCVLLKEAQHKQ